jgi:preprotein translocase subunit SecB
MENINGLFSFLSLFCARFLGPYSRAHLSTLTDQAAIAGTARGPETFNEEILSNITLR